MVQRAKTDRETILRTATDLLARQGLGGLSIRAVASALQLAPNAIYHYFDGLPGLLNAVAARVCGRLLLCLEEACANQSAVESVRSLAAAYLAFAREQHFLYEALLLPRPAEGEDAVAPERLWFFVVAQVRRVAGAEAAPEAAVALWAALHGLASLQSTKAFNEEKPLQSIDFALNAWLDAAEAARRREPQRRAERHDCEEAER